MNLNEILIMIAIGAGSLIIIGWTLIYYATMKYKDYHGYDDNKPQLSKEEKKELSQWTKNQDKNVPF
jgi:hypothetical protein